MKVRAKMKVTAVNKSGDPRNPFVNVQMGAVYSSDPESENRSFANATPTASCSMSIDPGRPAAQAFELGAEIYVEFTPAGVPDRVYVGDGGPELDGERCVIESRDKAVAIVATWEKNRYRWLVQGQPMERDALLAQGLTHWRHAREGELEQLEAAPA